MDELHVDICGSAESENERESQRVELGTVNLASDAAFYWPAYA